VMTVSPADGGSDVGVEWQREPSNLRGRIAIFMASRNEGKMLRGFFQKGFAQLEERSDLPTYRPPSAPS
jgi:hypothetical protein